MIFKYILRKWQNYRYRFVPWVVLNLKERKIRRVDKNQKDKVVTDETVFKFLTDFLEHLNGYQAYNTNDAKLHSNNLQKMRQRLGFKAERKPSVLPHGGLGVCITDGHVEPGTIVSMYPGTLYQPYQPILFQSINNPFIFRCIDGLLIDGNDKNLSKYIYRSCSQRDRHGPYLTSDLSWLTPHPVNPLAIGQYVNNQSTDYPANVAYQEMDLPLDFPFHLLKFIPNIFYTSSIEDDQPRQRRVVVLVSVSPISKGEELFSSYFTVVH